MLKYCFVDDEPAYVLKARDQCDPQVIGEALAQIAEAHGGRLTPSDTVKVARKKDHPLHQHFEWNDRAAANAHRLQQARAIIRMVRIVEPSQPEPPRAFYSVPERDGVSYRSYSDVMESADLQNAVLRAAERDLDAFERRYKAMTDVCQIVAEARRKVQERRKRNRDGDQPEAA